MRTGAAPSKAKPKKDAKKKKSKIYLRERIFIPAARVDQEKVEKYFQHRTFKEEGCAKCPYVEERFSEEYCAPCGNYLGEVILWGSHTIKGKEYVSVPIGHPERVERVLGISLDQAKELRKKIKFKYPFKWTGKLRRGEMKDGRKLPNQLTVARDWWQTKYGVANCPPRTGKTVIGTFLSMKLGVRTLIVAHQEELLNNFLDAIYGNKLRGIPAMTNIRKIEKEEGRRLVGIVRDMSDFDKYEICLFTYQKFIRKESALKRILKHIRGKFTFMIVDECHQAGAHEYSKFTNNIDVRYRLGLTATVERKDGLHRIVRDIIGPVVARSTVSSILPKVVWWETGFKPKYKHKNWAYAMRAAYQDEDRNIQIVRQVFKDLRAGHKAIIIPVDTKYHLYDLVERINRQARINIHKGEQWSKELAVALESRSDRGAVLRAIDSGDTRVLVAIRGMIKQGIDMKLPSMIYIVTPMSAAAFPTGAPFFYQMGNRVSTPYTGKEQPYIRVMIDNTPQSLGCFRSLFTQEILKWLRDNDSGSKRYLMDKSDIDRGFEILRARDNYVPRIGPAAPKMKNPRWQSTKTQKPKKRSGFAAL